MSLSVDPMPALENTSAGSAVEADRVLKLMRKDTELAMRLALKNIEAAMASGMEAVLQVCAQKYMERVGDRFEVPAPTLSSQSQSQDLNAKQVTGIDAELAEVHENRFRQVEEGGAQCPFKRCSTPVEAMERRRPEPLSSVESSANSAVVLTPMVAGGVPTPLVGSGKWTPLADVGRVSTPMTTADLPKNASSLPEKEAKEDELEKEETAVAQRAKQKTLDSFLAECGLEKLNSLGRGFDGISTNWNALHFAIIKGRCDIAQNLVDNPDFHGIDAVTSNGTSALLGAMTVEACSPKMMKTVLGCGRYTMINQPNNKMVSPLIAAASWGNTEILEVIVNQPGVDFNLRTPLGSTALHVAASKGGSGEAVRMIMDVMGESAVNAANNMGQTALHGATTREAAEALLQHEKFKVANARDSSGRTALHCAVMHNLPDLVTALLCNSQVFTETNAGDFKGRTALHFAVILGDAQGLPLVKALLAPHEWHFDGADQCLMHDQIGRTSLVDISVKDKSGSTALALALTKERAGNKDLVSYIESICQEVKFWRVREDLVVNLDCLPSATIPNRLVAGATLKELGHQGSKLHFLKVAGQGPAAGWLNISSALERLPLI